MEKIITLKAVADSVVFSLIGIVILVITFVIIEKITPENIYKQIVERNNTSIAIIFAAFIIAIAIIISSAIHG
jgi:putative membrane protein